GLSRMFHTRENRLDRSALLIGQLQLRRQLEHVRRPGIAIELGRARQPHAAAFAKIGELLLRETGYCPVLLAGIGLRMRQPGWMLRPSGRRCETGENQCHAYSHACPPSSHRPYPLSSISTKAYSPPLALITLWWTPARRK